jgi:single-strand DNA-binding protein
MPADNFVTITGNLADDPKLRMTNGGTPVCNFRVAVSSRVPDGKGGFTEGEAGFYRVTAWRGLAEHIVDSVGKGARVVVVGRLQFRTWQQPETDEQRYSVEIQAEEVAASLRWHTVTLRKAAAAKERKRAEDQFHEPPPF